MENPVARRGGRDRARPRLTLGSASFSIVCGGLGAYLAVVMLRYVPSKKSSKVPSKKLSAIVASWGEPPLKLALLRLLDRSVFRLLMDQVRSCGLLALAASKPCKKNTRRGLKECAGSRSAPDGLIGK
jgi:hypothetical protein